MSESRTEYKLKSPPEDGITNVTFGPNSSQVDFCLKRVSIDHIPPQFLLVSSWDKKVRLYDIVSNSPRCAYSHSMPVLDCAFQVLFLPKNADNLLTQDPIHVWSGGLDNILKSFDINSSTESAHGSHEGAIKCVEYSAECGLVVTGSWDSTV